MAPYKNVIDFLIRSLDLLRNQQALITAIVGIIFIGGWIFKNLPAAEVCSKFALVRIRLLINNTK
jgi:hypothetical protein